jgi:hypothetical protein
MAATIAAALLLPAIVGLRSIAPDARAAPSSCARIGDFVASDRDLGPVLQACFNATPNGGTVVIAPGRYRIATPIRINRPMTVRTQGLSADAPSCAMDERRCASLHLAIPLGSEAGAVMPFDIDSDAVHLDGLIFVGTRHSNPALSAQRCGTDKGKSMAGGLRIHGNGNSITRSVFRDTACYTALEYGRGEDVVIRDNLFSRNGRHNVQSHWADGLTIHTARRFAVTGNRFIDNSDVQLIFGSCVDCTISDNRFDHSGSAEGGSFAELMLHAWPGSTSGDFTGTRVTRNRIDCGQQQRCGFGIMIGSKPWYDAPAFGGTVSGNRVRGAMIALNIDTLTGPMTVEDNDLNLSSGRYPSMCGVQDVRGIRANISPASRPFVAGMPARDLSFGRYCILNFHIDP